MAGKLQQEIKQTKAIRLIEEEASLNIVRTADFLMKRLSDLLKPFRLSPTQYNLLRIVRGAGSDGVSCKDVGNRLLSRDPDITRLMDRLEKRGFLTRDRAKEDRRVVVHCLTPEGLALVNRLDDPVERLHGELMRGIGPDRLKEM